MGAEAVGCNWVDILTMVGTLAAAGAAIFYARDNNKIKKMYSESLKTMQEGNTLYREELNLIRVQVEGFTRQTELLDVSHKAEQDRINEAKKKERMLASPVITIWELKPDGNDRWVISLKYPPSHLWQYHTFRPISYFYSATTRIYYLLKDKGGMNNGLRYSTTDSEVLTREELVDRIRKVAQKCDFEVTGNGPMDRDYLMVIINGNDNMYRPLYHAISDPIYQENPRIELEMHSKI